MKAYPQKESKPTTSRRWKVLLVSANCCTTPEPVFPLGLAHVSAALRKSGHTVEWADMLMEANGFEEKLSDGSADLVGISVRNIDDVLIRRQENFVSNLGVLVETIHQKLGCPVVLGGSGFSILPGELLDSIGADFGIIGEGEDTFPALIAALEAKASYSTIPGLVFRRDNEITVNERGRLFCGDDLSPAHLPAEIAGYYIQNGGILNVQTQRGCAHRCCYCTYPVIEGTQHRRRPVESVIAEFEQLEALGARYAFIVDSVFNSSPAHVTTICEALARRAFKIRWGCFLRPQGLDSEMMRLMARAGLEHIEFGSDSFCDEVLEAYQKDFAFEDIHQSTELARKEEIDFCHFVIAGGPGETCATLEKGFHNSKRLGGAVIMAVPGMRVYPGTRLFELAVAEGRFHRGTNLLKPFYYLSPGLTLDMVLETLQRFASASPNWVVGDFDPAYESLVHRLRQRGITGPLWSYFATAQRLWPRQGSV
jgi:radical SAM superfamily enzyme YgiQ (UPF0313 family)